MSGATLTHGVPVRCWQRMSPSPGAGKRRFERWPRSAVQPAAVQAVALDLAPAIAVVSFARASLDNKDTDAAAIAAGVLPTKSDRWSLEGWLIS